MMIDDSELLLDVVGETLRDAGYEVVTRSLAVGAGAAIARERPDLVLLDVSMPLMSGDEITEAMRSTSLAQGTWIVLHSDRPERELEALVERCGADGFIRKTSDRASFLADVQSWVSRARHAESRRGADRRKGSYVLLACSAQTRLELVELVTTLPVRFTDSGAEALRYVLSAKPPAAVLLGTSLADVSCVAIYQAARRADASWRKRFAIVEEPGDVPTFDAEVRALPLWSTRQAIAALSALLSELQKAS